jgi:hypothetical protein
MSSELPAIAPGQSTDIALTVTVKDPKRAIVKIVAVQGDTRLPVEIPLFPPAKPFPDFRIADGQQVRIFQHATEKVQVTLGDGNGDGKANPGERIAILLPEDDVYRAAELFTNDACVDNTLRAFDDWSDYDHVGASAKYSLPLIKPDCPAGHVIHALARVLLPDKPNHIVRFAAIEFPSRVHHRPRDFAILPDSNPHADLRPGGLARDAPDLVVYDQRAISRRIGNQRARPHRKFRAARALRATLRAVRGVVRRFPGQIGHELRRNASGIEIVAVERDALGSIQIRSPRHCIVDEVVTRGIVLGHARVVEQPNGFAVEQSAIRAVPPLDQRTLRDCSHGRDGLDRRYGRRPVLGKARNANEPHRRTCATVGVQAHGFHYRCQRPHLAVATTWRTRPCVPCRHCPGT